MRSGAVATTAVAIAAATATGCGAATPPPPAPVAASASAPLPPAPPPPPAKLTAERVIELMKPLAVAPSAHNLIKNSTFDTLRSLPWTTSFTAPGTGSARVENGAFCLDVKDAGVHAWDAQIRHREFTVQKGHAYSVRLKIGATVPLELEVKVAMSGPPYKAYWHQAVDLDGTPQVVSSDFTMTADDDPTAELAIHVGGKKSAKVTPFTMCVDDVVLEDPTFQPKPDAVPPPVPNVLVNQVGYLPSLAKIAVVKTDAAAPLAWQLVDRGGATVAAGQTVVHGPDAASGDKVHWADFSAFAKPGAGYTMHVGSDASHPFDVGPKVYRKLKYDALAFFYQNRSGVPIAMPYAVDAKWARPAGHTGDKSVPCAPDAPCDYTLDVTGGWYDAGDHGKYVVNGGIAVWTLLDAYERAKALGTAGDFADGKMNLPENHNGVPDILDEARFELDFMMKMQVPEGKPLAGMAHHKVHDREWTALATRPDQDTVPRFLRPPSTAATLNLAATAAQCARVFRAVDAHFATRCLQSAERAWKAALANPAVYAPATDNVGGGPYEDSDVTDEFYWAAAELYATTKKDEYRAAFDKSPHRLAVPTNAGGETTPMTWGATSALGTISIAVAGAGAGVPPADVAAARAAIVKAADAFIAAGRDQGYPVPFRPSEGGYPWGSNSFILNNALVEGLAFDVTKDKKYADSAANALSYILGVNPNDQSYVTGYGFRPLEHPHHRFWAHQANAAFPPPPPGILSGGPNSGLQDPYVQADGLQGCAPMKCWVDNIEAWSANEEAINWNAPLAWVAAFLDERSR
jgi:endoglucanase